MAIYKALNKNIEYFARWRLKGLKKPSLVLDTIKMKIFGFHAIKTKSTYWKHTRI